MQNIGDNNVEIPSTFEGLKLEHLMDDLLVMVMQYLDVEDVFTCRLVSKRLESLALLPGVWRHRRLEAKDPWACPVLRLAPCLAKLVVHFPSTKRCHWLSASARCSVSELELTVDGDPADVALTIRSQAALGRLRRLCVYVKDGVQEKEAAALLVAVASTHSLERLRVQFLPKCGIPMSCFLRHALPSPSLKFFQCSLGANTDAFYNFILSRHAATLEEVLLEPCVYEAALTTASWSERRWTLLASITHLRYLRCPLFPGLEALAKCDSLSKVYLHLSPGSDARLESAVKFLRCTEKLRDLTLDYRTKDDSTLIAATSAATLVLVLSSSARSRATIESLTILGVQSTLPLPGALLEMLITALPRLPALRHLEVDRKAADLLRSITPATAPALRSLRVFIQEPSCRHSWVHRDPLLALLTTNPLLQLCVPLRDGGKLYCRGDSPCAVCALGCHRRLREERANLVKGKRKYFSWVLLPRDAHD
ncbi:uncharacterized protein LOC113209663 isoform X2 [Frankliniella occidentalis]|uniref:Uncharacterized protein LOC113209663 isoform X2 n=1 Tax=Frankliniella occidentalis TaxID=133901 RepID=A0A9C6X4R7_FRAOC|nr:uncharacterized protein LOC113209663 isoform X2 [Frankliniella occidentalis]